MSGGQITMYTVSGCPHCLHAKHILAGLGPRFVEVSLERNTTLQKWLKDKTGKTSVPQIFFNNHYIGGLDRLQYLMEDERDWEYLLKILETKEPLTLLRPTPFEDDSDEVTFLSLVDPNASLIRALSRSGIMKNVRLSPWSIRRARVFSGRQFVQWLSNARGIGEEQSIKEGTALVESKWILPVGRKSISPVNRLGTGPEDLYRLNEEGSRGQLNVLPGDPAQGPEVEATLLAGALRRRLLLLQQEFVTEDGKGVNYIAMRDSTAFDGYMSLAAQLRRVSIESLPESVRTAFFTNVYNAMVLHQIALQGPPRGFPSRLKFYACTEYAIGGFVLSLNDIENGILRANRRPPLGLCRPFAVCDRRRRFSLAQIDPRIHFALNCGARSCPPIRLFTPEGIDDELQLATESYLEGDDGVMIDYDSQGTPCVRLSSLFRWYSSDFGDKSSDVVQWVAENMADGEKKHRLREVLDAGKYKLSYLPYDWSPNETHSKGNSLKSPFTDLLGIKTHKE